MAFAWQANETNGISGIRAGGDDDTISEGGYKNN